MVTVDDMIRVVEDYFTMKDGQIVEMENVNLTEFRGARICAIAIWMAERGYRATPTAGARPS